MSKRIPVAAVLAGVCAIACLAAPAYAGATAVPVRVLAAAPQPALCTPEQEDQGATSDAAARDCHRLRAYAIAARARFYDDRAVAIRDTSSRVDRDAFQEVNDAMILAQDAAEGAQSAEDADTAADYMVSASNHALDAANSLNMMSKAGAEDGQRAKAASSAQEAAYNAGSGGAGRDVALNKAADAAEKAAQDQIPWT